jgi:hypothetical protein
MEHGFRPHGTTDQAWAEAIAQAEREQDLCDAVVEAALAFVLAHGPADGFLKDYDPLCDAVEALERAEGEE